MERHEGLVHAALQRFRMQKRVAIDDLKLAGLRGLEIGIDKWDPERGCLTTVACWYIRDHISKTYGRLQTAICLPATTLEQASQAAGGAFSDAGRSTDGMLWFCTMLQQRWGCATACEWRQCLQSIMQPCLLCSCPFSLLSLHSCSATSREAAALKVALACCCS